MMTAEEKSPAWVVIVNKESGIESLSHLDLYKIFSCTDTKYVGGCIDATDESDIYLMEDFVRYALDDKDMTFTKFKSKNLTRIRKREPVVLKMYNTYEEVVKAVSENKIYVGVIRKSALSSEVKACSLK